MMITNTMTGLLLVGMAMLGLFESVQAKEQVRIGTLRGAVQRALRSKAATHTSEKRTIGRFVTKGKAAAKTSSSFTSSSSSESSSSASKTKKNLSERQRNRLVSVRTAVTEAARRLGGSARRSAVSEVSVSSTVMESDLLPPIPLNTTSDMTTPALKQGDTANSVVQTGGTLNVGDEGIESAGQSAGQSSNHSITPSVAAKIKRNAAEGKRYYMEPVKNGQEIDTPAVSPYEAMDFANRLERWLAKLWPPAERPPTRADLYASLEEDRHVGKLAHTRSLTMQWTPVDCRMLDMDLKFVEYIHQGKRNKVLKMYDSVGGRLYAMKTFLRPDEFAAELAFLMIANHPYLVKAVCIRREGKFSERSGILFEYLGGRSQSMEYARHAGTEKVVRMSAQLLIALEYVHWLGYVHADMKPENVMVDSHGNIKVIDFGFAIRQPHGKAHRGTPTTMAPELQDMLPQGTPISYAIDWWAYGSTVAMWYSAALNPHSPVHGADRYVPCKYREGYFELSPTPKEFPRHLRHFMWVFFALKPEHRMFESPRLIHELTKLEFFKGLDWDKLA